MFVLDQLLFHDRDGWSPSRHFVLATTQRIRPTLIPSAETWFSADVDNRAIAPTLIPSAEEWYLAKVVDQRPDVAFTVDADEPDVTLALEIVPVAVSPPANLEEVPLRQVNTAWSRPIIIGGRPYAGGFVEPTLIASAETWHQAERLQGDLWAIANLKIYLLKDSDLSVVRSIPIPDGFDRDARGLAFDGSALWFIDFSNGEIVKVDPADGTELATFAGSSSQMRGIGGWDGTHFIVVDVSGGDELLLFDPSDGSFTTLCADVNGTPKRADRDLDSDVWYLNNIGDDLQGIDDGCNLLTDYQVSGGTVEGLTISPVDGHARVSVNPGANTPSDVTTIDLSDGSTVKTVTGSIDNVGGLAWNS